MSTAAIAQVECPVCKAAFSYAYRLLGSACSCSGCGRRIVPLVPLGGSYPEIGYEMDYGDFLQLLQEPRFHSLINNWWGYGVSSEDGRPCITNAAGENIDPLWLHLSIQSDSVRAADTYNLAMTLWR